jgi:hypothetical protein
MAVADQKKREHQVFKYLRNAAHYTRLAADGVKTLSLQFGDEMAEELADVAQQLEEFHVRIEEDA